jgi:hypothetical protein
MGSDPCYFFVDVMNSSGSRVLLSLTANELMVVDSLSS